MAIEFVLGFGIFMTAMFGIIDFSRWLYAYDSTVQATRHAARLSVVCDKTTAWSRIQEKTAIYMAFAEGGQLEQSWLAEGCTNATCSTVTVRAVNYTVSPYSPFLPNSLPLPQAQTTLVRESMESDGNDAICK